MPAQHRTPELVDFSTARANWSPSYLKGLFYGAPGTGKTTLLGTAPKAILLDVDGGAASVRKQDNVTPWRIESWTEFEDALFTLMSTDHGFETVELDTVTTLQTLAENHVGLADDFTNNKDPRRSYGAISAMMRHKLNLLFSLPRVHVIVAAHLRLQDGDEDNVNIEEGRFPLVPDVMPSIQKVVVALPDVIGRTFLKNTGTEIQYAVKFGPDFRTVAKHRALGLPPEATGVTIPKLIEKLKTSKTR